MSIRANLWVWEAVVKDGHHLSTHQLAVLLSLADRADEFGVSYASAAYHARRLNTNEKTVRRAAKELVDKELLEVEARPGLTPLLKLKMSDYKVLATPDFVSGVRGHELRDTPDTVSATPDRGSDDTVVSLEHSEPDGSSCGVRAKRPAPGSNVVHLAKPKPQARRFCPPTWEPSVDDIGVGLLEGLDEPTIQRELAKFRDHEFRSPRTDWSRTFRNWLREAATTASKKGTHADDKRARHDTNMANAIEGARRAAAEFEREQREGH